VAAARGALSSPRGLRAEAWWPFPDNPTLEYGRIRRHAPTSSSSDVQWSLTQEIEIAGQWAFRGTAASALIGSVEARVDDARRFAALDARRAYVGLAVAEQRAALADSAAAFAERLAAFAQRQFEAGETNRLEMNAAVLEAARAQSAAERAHTDAEGAAAELGRLVGLPRDTIPRITALPEVPSLTWTSDATLLRIARIRRPDLQASVRRRESAERSSTLARLGLAPNLAVSAIGGREAGTDNLLGVSLGLRIPLFHRQQAAIGLADADRAAARADEVAINRAILADVRATSARFSLSRAAERRFATGVLQVARENVTLTERALTEGEVSLTDVLVLRRITVETQLEYVELLRDSYEAWFALAAALALEPGELATMIGREGR
jgi:outer membrane protein TolC